MYPKLDNIRILLQRTELDFLMLQESFLTDGTPDIVIEIDNFNLFRLDQETTVCKKSGSGLITYVSSAYEVELINDWSVSSKDLEIMWLKLSLPHATYMPYLCGKRLSPTIKWS